MQISEEEKKSIELLRNSIGIGDFVTCNWVEVEIATEIVLNLIERQQAEYSDLKLKYEQGLLLHKKHVSELEIKNKMIDEIITYLFNLTGFRLLIKENGFCEKIKKCINDDKKCFKEYFRKKVEND